MTQEKLTTQEIKMQQIRICQTENEILTFVEQLIKDGKRLYASEWVEVFARMQSTFNKLALREIYHEQDPQLINEQLKLDL